MPETPAGLPVPWNLEDSIKIKLGHYRKSRSMEKSNGGTFPLRLKIPQKAAAFPLFPAPRPTAATISPRRNNQEE
jgi:hypothetical protein